MMNSTTDFVINVVSIPVCLTAATLVFGFKLHKVVVYRLALYQVLPALAFATVELLQVLMINYQDNQDAYGRVCIAIGWFGLYFILVNLLFNMWVTGHLFSFAVLHKNPTKLEPPLRCNVTASTSGDS
eukprot:Em0024g216a